MEVAEDLMAHFQDGARSGKSFKSLIGSFGEPEIVAKLIRNSKLRSRSMFAKVLKATMVGGGLMGLVYAGIAMFFSMGVPNPSTDFLAVINSNQIEVAEEDSGWSVYRESWSRHGFCEGRNRHFEEIYLDKEGSSRLVKPADDGWDAAITKLSDSQDLLAALRKGAKRPFLGLVLQSDRSKYSDQDFAALFPHLNKEDLGPDDNYTGIAGFSDEDNEVLGGCLALIQLPHIQSFRKAARILVVDTRWAIEQDDIERAARNIEAIFGLANQASDSHCLVCDLVGFAISNIGFDLLDEVLSDDTDLFDDAQLTRIQSAVANSDFENWIQFDAERAMMHDLIQRVYTDDGSGDGHMTSVGFMFCQFSGLFNSSSGEESGFAEMFASPNSLTAPVSLLFVASRKQMLAKLDELYDEVDKRFSSPIYEDDMEDLENFFGETSTEFFLISNNISAFIRPIRKSRDRQIGNRNGILVAIAAHRHRLEHGEWPDSLENLADDLLPLVPADVCNGQALKYKLSEDGFIVYSTGIDGDDDGGVRQAIDPEVTSFSRADFNPWDSDKDGDWVLWPAQSE